MNDEDLIQRIRAARPNLPRRNEALGTRAETTMRAIMDAPAQDTTPI